MTKKLTYEDLERRVKELEEEAAERKGTEVFCESEQQWRSLLENSPSYIAVADHEGTIQYINRTAPGITVEEVIGKNIDDFKSPVYHEISRNAIKKVFQFGESGSYQVRALGPNKNTSWYEVHFGPIKRDGQVVAIAYSTIDISWRKSVEEALEASEKRYRAVVENQTELICRFLPEGKLTFVNEAYCRYFGKKLEDLVDSKFMPLIPEEDRKKVEAHFASITPHTPVATHEHQVFADDGTVRWHRWTNQGIFDDQGYIVEYQSVGRDITEQKKVEKELARIEKLESLGILAGGIAHDFNNLLTPILSNISMARIYGELDREVAEMLADAEKATLRAKSLTQQLLTFSKGGAPVKRVVSVSKLLEDASTFALSGSNVNCQYSIPEDLWPVGIDEGQIAQVIQNLMINADQAMPRGGTIEIRAENVVIGEKDTLRLGRSKHVRVSIRDQGIGISKEDMANIFDPFFTTKQRGSGLGLSTSFTIVEQHEGTIQVES